MEKSTDWPVADKPATDNWAKPDVMSSITPIEIREYRKARQESQKRFWGRFGVTQSRGSRFELGMAMPAPVAILLSLYWRGVVSEGDLWRAGRSRRNRRSADINREKSVPGAPPLLPPRAGN